MKEELTAEMHYDFMKRDVSRFDFKVFAVEGDIRQGKSKEEACKRRGITVEEFDANIERVLSDPSW